MATRKSKKSPASKKAPAAAETSTFSTRLSTDQRELVERAARLKNWSPAQLIRIAALERSAHILNTAEQTRFDFKGLANQVATQLTAPETKHYADDGPELVVIELGDPPLHNISCEATSLDWYRVDKLKNAIRLGGAEFMEMVLDLCISATAEWRSDLPKPIDPQDLAGEIKGKAARGSKS